MRIALEIAARLAQSEAERQARLKQGRRRAYNILTRPWAVQALSEVAKSPGHTYEEEGYGGVTLAS